MLRAMLRGPVQLPQEQWNTEGTPFNNVFDVDPSCETWDVVEGIAERLGIAMWTKGDRVYFDRGDGNYGDFDNSTGGVGLAMRFLRGIYGEQRV